MAIRTSQPAKDNKYYLKYPYGYNKCILGNKDNSYNARPSEHSVLPNCVGYAYGRYLEYWNIKEANLPTCNAKDWFSVGKKNGFKCTDKPSVGSVIVFAGTKYGHVAFVERIESNGDLCLSESNWNGRIFRNVTVKKSNGYAYSSTIKCIGFVANPNAKEEPKYIPGNYKVKTDLLHVRKGAGLKYAKKVYSELTKSAQTKILALKKTKENGYVKGLTFTCTEVKEADGYTWGKTPSGWVALEYCERI